MDQHRTPLFDTLIQHDKQQPLSFHVPGHKNGVLFPSKANPYYSSILSIDVTELTGLDDLHAPEGAIREAEELLANIYRTRHSFFLINGSTVGNLTMILSTFEEGDIVFVQRNCHKSILNGLKLAKLKPIFIEPDFNENWKVATSISKDSLQAAHQAYPKGKGVILTYPNYYGFASDIKEIIDYCHLYGMVVLVDEAHGAHFIAGEPFPPSALQLGADMVVQSAHKTLPAMTMAAYLHINSERIPFDTVKSYLQVLQSSSPSYPLMASLDIARSYIATYDEEDKKYLEEQLAIFIKKLKEIPVIKVLHHQSKGDPLKIVLQSNQGNSGFDLQRRLESVGVYSELADSHNVLLVFPLLKKGVSYPVLEVSRRIQDVLKGEIGNATLRSVQIKRSEQIFSSLEIEYKEQLQLRQMVIPLVESMGENSAEMIIPYPPGIPLFMEGEKITSEKLEILRQLIQLGARFHGGEFLGDQKIKIYKR
ncbi:aminotransferase class I/II-fold pyridoxal phosphate-dependent enzyme [Bacillus sp. CGMCC 1.16607]|uniref:aminotransferase class I/II-fold pyridoxal phosphate-dependent enzyme n=1 Tax=Bacillus sp. CGMCC 1.16607 TaxID=3351842 RepID=UPI003627DB39